MAQRTLCIIKPDAIAHAFTDAINEHITKAGFTITKQKSVRLTKDQAQQFYAIHKDKPFYDSLCRFMSSGTSIVQILSKPNAIEEYRQLMGATNPEQAKRNSLRQRFGSSIEHNAVHGSDSPANAAQEIAFFFPEEAETTP